MYTVALWQSTSANGSWTKLREPALVLQDTKLLSYLP